MTVSCFVDLTEVPAVDGHAHPLRPDPWALTPEAFADYFSEGRPGAMVAHVPHTVYFRRTVHDLARRLGVEPTAEAVLTARRALGAESGRRALSDARVEHLLVDTGYPPDAMALADMRRHVPSAVHEVFRVETCAQALLARGLPYPQFLEAFRTAVREGAGRAVGLKSIIAYRSGLAVRPAAGPEAEAAYRAVLDRIAGGGTARLTDKPLLDALFMLTLEAARDTGRPLQVHTGFGDPDIDLLVANPLLLRPIVEAPRWAGVRIVLLHMAYPYFGEAAYLAAVWPHVYVDLSLAIPFLGPGVVPPLVETLALAPATKLLYGSDVGGLPELFALCADWGRAALGEALGWLVERGGLSGQEARTAGKRILQENARALYALY
jgi:uncharacterized protein